MVSNNVVEVTNTGYSQVGLVEEVVTILAAFLPSKDMEQHMSVL